MPFSPFHEYFPEIAEKETRFFTTLEDSDLPIDSYSLIESYCDEPGCDKLVCPRDGAEYKKDYFKCIKHYRLWQVCQGLKWVIFPFVKFQDK